MKNTGTVVWQIPIDINTLETAVRTLGQDVGSSESEILAICGALSPIGVQLKLWPNVRPRMPEMVLPKEG